MRRDQVLQHAFSFFVLFCAGFGAGCVFLNYITGIKFNQIGEQYLLTMKLAFAEIEAGETQKREIYIVGAVVLFIGIAGFTIIGQILIQGMIFCFGMMGGAAITAAYLDQGLAGPLILFLYGMPQLLFFAAGIIGAVILSCNMSTNVKLKSDYTLKNVVKYGFYFTILVGILIVGAILRRYVNQFFVDMTKNISK